MLTVLIILASTIILLELIFGFLVLRRLSRPQEVDMEKVLREEFRQIREESNRSGRELREEVSSAQNKANQTLVQTIQTLGHEQRTNLAQLTEALQKSGEATRQEVGRLVASTGDDLKEIRSTTETKLEAVRKTTEERLRAGDEAQERRGKAVTQAVQGLTDGVRADLVTQKDAVQRALQQIQAATESRLDAVRATIEQRLAAGEELQQKRSQEAAEAVRALVESNRLELNVQKEAVQKLLQAIQASNEQRFDQVRAAVEEKLRQGTEEQNKHLGEVIVALQHLEKSSQEEQGKARESLEQKFRQIQESNEKKLEEMRQTVDEKLHRTLEARLGESFKLVSDRLEAVQKGLGEMQSLATGVGDLKRVLTNVKDRGTWGEYQLGAILEEILTPDQYATNVQPKAGGERVEYAIRLPGQAQDPKKPLWLPIDAKFPKEDYERLMEASRLADANGVEESKRALLAALQKSAKDIHDKYISPPDTTDFAIMFLPTEGLYAEALRQPGFHDELQRKYRVLVVGPTVLSAFVTSLRVGFQTLAIEHRANEIREVLGAVKNEFGKFGNVLDKVKKQLTTASNTIDETATRTRAMARKLREVEELPAGEAQQLLGLPEATPSGDEDEGEPLVIKKEN